MLCRYVKLKHFLKLKKVQNLTVVIHMSSGVGLRFFKE